MDILELDIENFLAIEKATISLSNKGLVLIQGENHDDTSACSNGVGKSSVADSLCWALYGETARGVSGDAVVNNLKGKNCKVGVFLKDGDTHYSVVRYRKHKEGKSRIQLLEHESSDLAGPFTDLTSGTDKQTQEQIDKILGCSKDVFLSAIYAGQEIAPNLPAMTDKQLKVLIEEAAGIDRIEDAYTHARSRALEAKGELSGAQSDLEKWVEKFAATEDIIATLEKSKADFEVGRKERVMEWVDKAREIKTQMGTLAAEIESLESVDHRAIIEACELAFKDAEPAQNRVDIYKANYDRLKGQSVSLAHQLKRAKDAVETIAKRTENAQDALKKPCPECGKPHTEDDLETLLKSFGEKAKLANQELAEVQVACAEIVAETNKAKDELAKAQASLPDLIKATEMRAASRSGLAEIARKIEELKKIGYRYDETVSVARKVKEEPFPSEKTLIDSITVLNACKGKIESLRAQVESSTVKVSMFEQIVETLGPSGVRAHILDTVTPYLNDRTAEYLTVLSDGNITAVWSTLGETAKGELREKFNIDVSNVKGSTSFMGLSGGEKRKVRLACMLALQDLVSSRATKPINLYLADEIDDALDKSGLERLMTILERKARERGTVLVISHNDLRDWIDQQMTVIKRDGISTVEGSCVLVRA